MGGGKATTAVEMEMVTRRFVAAIIIVPLVAIVGWLLLQFRKPPKNPVPEASSGGLLARAEAKVNQS